LHAGKRGEKKKKKGGKRGEEKKSPLIRMVRGGKKKINSKKFCHHQVGFSQGKKIKRKGDKTFRNCQKKQAGGRNPRLGGGKEDTFRFPGGKEGPKPKYGRNHNSINLRLARGEKKRKEKIRSGSQQGKDPGPEKEVFPRPRGGKKKESRSLRRFRKEQGGFLKTCQ